MCTIIIPEYDLLAMSCSYTSKGYIQLCIVRSVVLQSTFDCVTEYDSVVLQSTFGRVTDFNSFKGWNNDSCANVWYINQTCKQYQTRCLTISF